MGSQLIIRICHHILPHGRHCRAAAVRGRTCCRHHLDARTRFHNMARARRRTLILRLRVAESPRDLALNRAEVNRLLGTGRLDPDAARMMRWAMELSATVLRYELHSDSLHSGRCNPNQHYYLPPSPSFARSYIKNPMQAVENTMAGGRGLTCSPPLPSPSRFRPRRRR
jgi:hypothetical protein